MNAIFDKDEFTVQIICSGAFADSDPSHQGKVFLVETSTIRLNHIALNEWGDAQVHNCRECYDTDQEWQDYLAMKKARLNIFKKKIAAAVGYDPDAIGVSVIQVVSEVFSVAHIHEVFRTK